MEDQLLGLPKALDELSIKKKLLKINERRPYTCFIGAGASNHFVPEWISQQLLRAEWYTCYTPYQAEVSQGTLQAIFEFQSIVADLLGLEVANASMYDGATSLVEALLMAVRIKKIDRIVIAKSLHPHYQETIITYFSILGIEIIFFPFKKDGASDINALEEILKNNQTSAIAIMSPNFFGIIEDLFLVKELSLKYNCFFISGTTDCTSLGLLNSPGHYGADIAIAEGLGLLGGLSLGGPGVGLFSTKLEYVRQMPGRLVGQTTDKNSDLGYVLTLSTREQHIRREKATSNICTNHNLMALAFLMCVLSYGKNGFRDLAIKNVKKTLYLRKLLARFDLSPYFLGHHYNETVIKFKNESILKERIEIAKKKHILPGLLLEKSYPNLKDCLLIYTSELHDDEDMEKLANILGGTYG